MIYNPSEIEEELLRVQRNVSPSEARTSLFNLVVFTSRDGDRYADKAIGHLLGRRPARVLQIRPASGAESDIHVSARCLLDSENQSVCIQEVIIDAAFNAAPPGLWSPLLIHDIPVYVLWLDTVLRRKDDLLLASEQADKIIIDSAVIADGGEDVGQALGTLLEAHQTQDLLFADLAWVRLEPLRESVAQLFNTPEDVDKLKDLARVEIAHIPPVEASLFVGWLASRLGWRGEEGRHRDAQGREVAVETREGRPDAGRASVSFRTFAGEKLQAEADGEGCMHLVQPDGRSTTRIYSVVTIGEALLEEVDTIKVDSVFLEAAKATAAG